MVRLVATVAVAGAAVAVALPGGPVRPVRPDLSMLAGAAVLAVVAVLTYVDRASARVAAAALATVALGWSGYLVFSDLSSGLPGPSTAVLAVAALAAAAGTVADALRPVRLSFAAPLIVVLTAVAVAAGLLAPRLPVRASETEAVDPPALAREPGEQRWSWRTPDAVLGVVAAGAGVVVAVEGGELTALDGSSGAVRWRYARPGSVVGALSSTPDRTAVAATFLPGGRTTGVALLVVLDAITGSVHRESIVDSLRTLSPTNTALPDRGTENRVRATDLRTGDPLWTWSPPQGCELPPTLPPAGVDVVLAPLRCATHTRLVALDDRTGTPRWESPSDPEMTVNPDGTLLTTRDVVLHTRDGSELTRVDRRIDVTAGTHPLLTGAPTDEIGPEVVDPTTGDRTELPRITCDHPRADTTTASAYLRLCDEDAQATLTWQNTTGDSQVSRTPLDWGPSTSPTARMLGGRVHALILPSPGAIVVARAGDLTVTGYPD